MSLDLEVMKSYDFYTDLFIPQLRYDPIGTNSVYLNSITSVYKEDSLKLEVITGREDFVAAYTVLAIEFENLKGETTGRIEIPAEEVNSTHLFFTDFVHFYSELKFIMICHWCGLKVDGRQFGRDFGLSGT